MKTNKQFKKNLKLLKKEKAAISLKMKLDYKVLKRKLLESHKLQKDFKSALKEIKLENGFRNKFRKALAKELGVKYSAIKDRLPEDLNSTSIANFLDPHLEDFSHQEIRAICQGLKLEFGVG